MPRYPLHGFRSIHSRTHPRHSRTYPRHSHTLPRHSREGGNLHLPASHLTNQNSRTIMNLKATPSKPHPKEISPMRETCQPPTTSPAGPPHDHTLPRHSYTPPLHSPRLPTSIPAPSHVNSRTLPRHSRTLPRHSRTLPRHSREGGNLHLPASHLTNQNPRTILDPWSLQPNHSPRKHLAIHNLQSTIHNAPTPPSTEIDTILQNPTKIRVCAHAREATAFRIPSLGVLLR